MPPSVGKRNGIQALGGQRRGGVGEGPAGRRAHVDVPAEDDPGPHPVGRPGCSRRVGDSLVGGSGVPVVFRVVGVQERRSLPAPVTAAATPSRITTWSPLSRMNARVSG